jgi:hypothetical protein
VSLCGVSPKGNRDTPVQRLRASLALLLRWVKTLSAPTKKVRRTARLALSDTEPRP